MYVLSAVCLLCVALFLVVRVAKGGAYGILTKILASFAFMVVAIVGTVKTGMTTFAMFVVLGLLCGLIGDFVLDNKVVYKEHENIYLNAGMLSFGIGHVFYFVAATILMVSLGVQKVGMNLSTFNILISLAVSVVATTGIMLLSKPMKLDFGKFFFQTLAYTLILTFMSAYSVALAIAVPTLWTFAVGICLIFLSDLILSTQYFGGQQDNKLFIVLNHAIYYLGQLFIAVTLFLV